MRRTTAGAVLAVGIGITLAACSSSTEARAEQSPSTSAAAASTARPRIDPFVGMEEVPSFTLTSEDVADGAEIPAEQRSGIFGVPDGQDVSPELSWSGFPEGTQSFVVTVFDGDAVTGSGFWHWAVKDIPASTTSLPSGAGSAGGSDLPAGAVELPGDAGAGQYIGAAPPQGDVPHHYFVTVWALDIPSVDVPDDASVALLSNAIQPHVLARATMVPVAQG